MKNKTINSSSYQKINKDVPKNNDGFHRSLLEISKQPQYIPAQTQTSKQFILAPLGMAATTICFIFLFSLHVVIGDIKSLSVKKDLQLELSTIFLDPSSQLLYSELNEELSQEPINQMIINLN